MYGKYSVLSRKNVDIPVTIDKAYDHVSCGVHTISVITTHHRRIFRL